MNPASDVLVVGAGVVGSAIAYFATLEGLSVTVLERGLPASGTSSACEGNILVSDKEPGPELELTKYSLGVWKQDLAEHADLWEFEGKGGIIVASRESSLASLNRLTAAQRSYGVDARELSTHQLRDLEPNISPGALGAAYYPEDSQVQPMLAAAQLLRMARANGARFFPNTKVAGFLNDGGKVTGVRTSAGNFAAGAVANATGTWAADLAALAGANVPVKPRRGFVMVTEPLPPMIHHKVYAAEYVDNVGSSDAGLQSSPVVEGTPAGSILIGSSRERVGFDGTVSVPALRAMAENATELFPFLNKVKILRHYHGFRPYCPDHLPVIGHDERAPGLWHASGHEGAGIGLSVGTGKLMAQALAGKEPDLSLAPFAPHRFGGFQSGSTTIQEACA
ncbi:NAD(P)/FAD-dependent oxidoreductase [Arthrobacter sp. VKM Ac-2550]|uniref:NAD(P)/FAD-dependent oxidoreductase n=1 Tax=Crystallibacter permensis TaxID=1938888 RepID=UPI0022261040|nr:FAD-binding oxidoreductase [Arthrobacter sp. VKM Ac-2550]MCW2132364.1 Glycine/D-amino acid oxidase (deaminating) [Arthrobacter sp. VKM Ac-2550]